MSPERKAVVGLLLLAAAGHGLRLLAVAPAAGPGAIMLPGSRPGEAAAARRDSLAARARPLGPGERIDLDRAPAEELARLPGVGMALAKRIVADREALGPFGGLEGLDRVRGVGPALLERVAPHVAVSGGPAVGVGRTDRYRSPAAGVGTSSGRAPPDRPSVAQLLDLLNGGTAADLERLPGIGPARARRIVAFRDSAGPFPTLEALGRVPGVPRSLPGKLVSHSPTP